MFCPSSHPYALGKGTCCCAASRVESIPNPSVTTLCTECATNPSSSPDIIKLCTSLGSEYCVNAGMFEKNSYSFFSITILYFIFDTEHILYS